MPKYSSISPFLQSLFYKGWNLRMFSMSLKGLKHIRYGQWPRCKPEGCHHPAKIKCKNTRWLLKATLNFHGDIQECKKINDIYSFQMVCFTVVFSLQHGIRGCTKMNDKSFFFISEGTYRIFAGESEEELVIFWCNFEVFCILLLTD